MCTTGPPRGHTSKIARGTAKLTNSAGGGGCAKLFIARDTHTRAETHHIVKESNLLHARHCCGRFEAQSFPTNACPTTRTTHRCARVRCADLHANLCAAFRAHKKKNNKKGHCTHTYRLSVACLGAAADASLRLSVRACVCPPQVDHNGTLRGKERVCPCETSSFCVCHLEVASGFGKTKLEGGCCLPIFAHACLYVIT